MNKARILPELEKILDTGWIGLGPKTQEFEEKFATYQGAKYGIGVNSATAALHMAIVAAGLKAGDEVLVPTMTFASTALVLLYEKVIPVFVDCDPETLCLDLNDAEQKITSKTKAIMPVHFGGHAVPMDELMSLAKKKNLIVIEDCAHAAGGMYKSKPLGSIGLMSCFSFHAVKNLPTGDGGMVLTNDPALNKHLRSLRWLGIDKDTWSRSGGKYAWRYSISELGYKYHMNDITAVIGLAQLETLTIDNGLRRKLAERYAAAFAGHDGLETPKERSYAKSSWHNYVVKLKTSDIREDFIAHLASKGISAGVHYEPIHLHNVFRGKSRADNLLHAEKVWPSLVTLPLYPGLSFKDQDFVIETTVQFLAKNKIAK